jgi:hypothetical protein
MNETRGIVTITEELADLRRYLGGLPKPLVETGAFAAYQKRESLLQEELIAAQIYRIVGQPTSSTAEPFSGLKGKMTNVLKRMSEFQESLRRRARIRGFVGHATPSVAGLASVLAAYFIVQSENKIALFHCGVAVLAHFLYSILGSGEQIIADKRRLSKDIETLRWELEAYASVEDTENQVAQTQREVLLSKVRHLVEENAGS